MRPFQAALKTHFYNNTFFILFLIRKTCTSVGLCLYVYVSVHGYMYRWPHVEGVMCKILDCGVSFPGRQILTLWVSLGMRLNILRIAPLMGMYSIWHFILSF